MQELLTEMIVHMAHSHQQMARILDAKRKVTVRMAQLVDVLPDAHPHFNGLEGLLDNTFNVTKSVVTYLNSLADLEEAVADSLTNVVKSAAETEEE
jgi:hypothetical protein